MTNIQRFINKYKPCQKAIDWLLTQKNLKSTYYNCQQSDWMWWAIRTIGLADKDTSVKYANLCAERVKYLKNSSYAAAAAADDAAAYAAYATYAAAADADAAATYAAADAAADAAVSAAADARKQEQIWQCEQLRILIPYNKIKI